jgi:hypothetical protein
MQSSRPNRTLIRIAISISLAVAALACQNSNSVTGPPSGNATPAASIAGSWNGSFQPDDSMTCGGSSASATFQQDGSQVTGNLRTSDCGVSGYFKGTLMGSTLVGSVKMDGCVGGGVSGTVSGSAISLSIGDLTKPLVTGDTPVMTGGIVTLSR